MMPHALRQVLQLFGETDEAWLYSSPQETDPIQHLALHKAQYPHRPEVIAVEVTVLQEGRGIQGDRPPGIQGDRALEVQGDTGG